MELRRRALAACLLAGALACGSDSDSGPGDAAASAAAQSPPGTDIWLASLSRAADGSLSVTGPVNVTARPGYDNQPYFLPDGSGFWYTVIDDAGQADIWRYDLVDGRSSPVTATSPESEYSATPLPDGSGISVVRVEADSTQRLWRFDADGSGAAVLLEDVAPVGYHAWADERTVVMFVLGDPPTLQVARPGPDGSPANVLASDIGRSIQPIPGSGDVSFVQRAGDGSATIMRLSPGAREAEPLIDAVDGGDFHAWTPGGTLLMGGGATLYAWTPGGGEGWTPVADLSGLGISVSRLAVSPDGSQIAIVGEPGA